MTGPPIQSGAVYALVPSETGRPLRPVTALRVQGSYLIYAGPSGAEWAADLSRIPGPWADHAQAADRAANAVRELRGCLDCQAVTAVEAGYRDYHIQVILSVLRAELVARRLDGAA